MLGFFVGFLFVIVVSNAENAHIAKALGYPHILYDYQQSFYSIEFLEETSRDKSVLIVHSVIDDSSFVELLFLLNSLPQKNKIRLLMPYICYSRIFKNLDLITRILKSAKDIELWSVDLHTLPPDVNNISVTEFWKDVWPRDALVVAADAGAVSRYPDIAYDIKLIKSRKNGFVDRVSLENEDTQSKIQNRHCFIIDDVIDTGETILQASTLLMENGAVFVGVCATHAVLSGESIKLIEKNPSIKFVYVTDTIKQQELPSKFKVLPIAEFLKKTISQ